MDPSADRYRVEMLFNMMDVDKDCRVGVKELENVINRFKDSNKYRLKVAKNNHHHHNSNNNNNNHNHNNNHNNNNHNDSNNNNNSNNNDNDSIL